MTPPQTASLPDTSRKGKILWELHLGSNLDERKSGCVKWVFAAMRPFDKLFWTLVFRFGILLLPNS